MTAVAEGKKERGSAMRQRRSTIGSWIFVFFKSLSVAQDTSSRAPLLTIQAAVTYIGMKQALFLPPAKLLKKEKRKKDERNAAEESVYRYYPTQPQPSLPPRGFPRALCALRTTKIDLSNVWACACQYKRRPQSRCCHPAR